MITLRLDPETEQKLTAIAKSFGITKSELIRKSIKEYLAKLKNPTPFDLGKDLFGNYASNHGELSSKRKSILKEKIRNKNG